MAKEEYFIEARDAFYEQNDLEKKYNLPKEVYDNICTQFYTLGKSCQPSLPSNLDEAAEEYADKHGFRVPYDGSNDFYDKVDVKASLEGFKAGVKWLAGQGWIDDGRMPTEKEEESDTLQGHHEWTASEPVLAWDSMYGPRIDFTRNGKWVSEAKGGYIGQICHGIVAWMPIPQYKEIRDTSAN